MSTTLTTMDYMIRVTFLLLLGNYYVYAKSQKDASCSLNRLVIDHEYPSVDINMQKIVKTNKLEC